MNKEYEITIKVTDEEFRPSPVFIELPGPSIREKVEKAYKEAKEKEIKVGDWVLDPGRNQNDIYQVDEAIYKNNLRNLTKLSHNLQEGLNKLIEDQSNG